MEPPPAEKEAVTKMKQLETSISSLEAVPTTLSLALEVEQRKKDLQALKKKYPQRDLHARDYAQYVGPLADVEE